MAIFNISMQPMHQNSGWLAAVYAIIESVNETFFMWTILKTE